jgi:pimeloyl-ACP methyl ester carboxylesterase
MLVFTHGNSFPAGTYRALLDGLREHGHTVQAIEKVGHNPQYPVTNNWPHLVQELADFTESAVQHNGGPVWLVGHSLGGFLSLMVAARHPALARGVVLMDSPIVGGWRATVLKGAKASGLVGSFSPGAVSRQRRNGWATIDEAYAHFRHKRAFAAWSDGVLWDYVTHCTTAHEGRRVLAFDPAVETQIYNTLPDNLPRLLQRQPPSCPVSFIGGIQSAELRAVGLALTHKVTRGRMQMVDGSHLFPMERPLVTAAAIETALLNMAQLPPALKLPAHRDKTTLR